MNRYRIVIAVENSGMESIWASDPRPHSEIVAAWFLAMRKQADRATRNSHAAAVANMQLNVIQRKVMDLACEVPEKLPEPPRDYMQADECLLFSGDAAGVGAAVILPGTVYAIEQVKA